MGKWLLLVAIAAAAYGWHRSQQPESSRLPTERISHGELVKTIADRGQDVDINKYLVPGTWSLFEYTADW